MNTAQDSICFFIDNIYPMVDAAPKALWLSTITDTCNIYSRCDEVQVQQLKVYANKSIYKK
jgi:hypothetical protein